MKRKNIIITPVFTDNGECDLGCWNDAEGFIVEIDGVVYDDLKPFASCTTSCSYSSEDLLNFVLGKIGVDIDLEWAYPKEI